MNKLFYLFDSVILLICVFSVSRFSETPYLGVEMQFNITQYIFSTLIIVCQTIVVRERRNDLFKGRNLGALVRYHSRKRALQKELLRVSAVVLCFQIVECAFIFIFNFSKQGYSFKSLAVYFIFNLIIRCLFAFIQMSFQVYNNNSFSFMGISAFYISSLFLQLFVYQKQRTVKEDGARLLLSALEKANIVNYMSVSKHTVLFDKLFAVFAVIAALTVLEVIIIIRKISRKDFLDRE